MTPHEARETIKVKFPVFLNRDMARVSCKGKTLIVTGDIMAVRAIDKYVMQGIYPIYCKVPAIQESAGKSTYTYNFERI